MKILKIFSFVILSLALTGTVLAQTPTDAVNLRDSVKQQVEAEMSRIQQAVSKKAFLGSITSKNEAAININNYQNQARQALVTTDTVIKLRNGRDGTPKDLTVGDFILVMGDVDSRNIMTAKRLLVVPAPVEDTRTISSGRVTTVASGTMTVETPDKKTVTAKLQSSTVVNKTETGASVKAKTTDIKVGDSVVMIYRSGASIIATNVHITGTSPAASPTP